jgi:hypothetical protein
MLNYMGAGAELQKKGVHVDDGIRARIQSANSPDATHLNRKLSSSKSEAEAKFASRGKSQTL